MNVPIFRTNEVAQAYEDVRAWSHAEYPFLDAQYSPGSHVPAIDLTPYIAKWLATGNIEAITELWRFLTFSGDASEYALHKALIARLPSWIQLSETVRHELHAIHLLTVRAGLNSNHEMSSIASILAATSLACEAITVDQSQEHSLAKATQMEFTVDSFPQPVSNKAEATQICIHKASSPLGIAEPAAQRLKLVPPMVRLVLFDYQTRNWNSGILRFELYYGERLYGCGKRWNQHYIEWLDFFEFPTDTSHIPAALTKEVLFEALIQQQLQCKNSATRKQMIELAKTVPGLLAILIHQVYPEGRKLRAEWSDAVGEWTARLKLVRPVAAGLLKLMSVGTI